MPLLSKIDVLINGNALKGFQSISINQNLYGIDRFEIVCRYNTLEKLDAFIVENSKDFLGSSIVIQTKISAKDKERDGIIFKGYITEIQGARSDLSDNNHVLISGGSSEIVLNRKPTNKSFIEKNLEDIVNEVLKTYGLRSKVSPRNKNSFPYIVQFEESDLEFLKRLSIRYGEWFFYDGQEIIFGEIPDLEESLRMGINLHDLRYELRVAPVKFSLFSADPLKKDVYEYQSGNSKIESNLNLYGKHALNRSKDLYSEEGRDYYEHLNVSETEYSKGLEEVGRIEEASDAVNLTDISGSSVAGFLSAGMKVKITCPGKDGKGNIDYGKYLVTSVNHNLEDNLNYSNQFAAIPAETAIPENTDPNFVKTTYQQIARVVNNDDPEKLGRVKVSFAWMDGKQETPWIKYSTPYTSSDAGIYFIPAIDSRVIVGFEDGDVEKPYCIGSLFDEDKNPDSAWSGNHDSSNAKIHAIRTQSGQTIELYDDSGSEKICIYDTGGKNEIVLDSANGEITIRAENKISLQAKEIEIKADQNISAEAGQSFEQKGMDVKVEAQSGIELKGLKVDISAQTSLKTEGSASAEISSGGVTTVKGSLVQIN